MLGCGAGRSFRGSRQYLRVATGLVGSVSVIIVSALFALGLPLVLS